MSAISTSYVNRPHECQVERSRGHVRRNFARQQSKNMFSGHPPDILIIFFLIYGFLHVFHFSEKFLVLGMILNGKTTVISRKINFKVR